MGNQREFWENDCAVEITLHHCQPVDQHVCITIPLIQIPCKHHKKELSSNMQGLSDPGWVIKLALLSRLWFHVSLYLTPLRHLNELIPNTKLMELRRRMDVWGWYGETC